MSIARQCRLVQVSRSSVYTHARKESSVNTALRTVIAAEYASVPVYGVRRMTAHLRRRGYMVNHKRIERLYRMMGLRGIIGKRSLSKRNVRHPVYPYLLTDMAVVRPNQVWATDITYIRMQRRTMYVMAIIDHRSRYIVGWGLSLTLEADFCRAVLSEALAQHGAPEIVNTDQGSQFTSTMFTDTLRAKGIKISMDGKGRALDNIFIERLWKTLKYEHLYINDYDSESELLDGLREYFVFYNNQRLHQSLGYRTPAEVYYADKMAESLMDE
jgi:putative transposase